MPNHSSRSDLPGTSRGVRLPRSERRAQLLEAAQQVFVEHGYHAAGMDEIADRAGVSKPVLYQHFPGKLDLYLALLDQANEQMMDAVVAALSSTEDNKQRVIATMEAYFEFVSREGAPYRLVFESDLINDPQVSRRVQEAEKRTAETLARLIWQDTGLSDERALLVAQGVTGMAQTSARFWLAQGRAIPLGEAARLVAALAWRGIGAFPRRGVGR